MTTQQSILDALLTVLDEDRALAVMDHRRVSRKPLTVHAAKLLAVQFARCADPNEGADEMIMRGWQGFRPEWIRDRNLMRPTRAIAGPTAPQTGHGLIDALARHH